MEAGSNHIAGIVPVAGQPLDFKFPWHDCMQPINKNYLAVEHAVGECAYAGCKTIWVVCSDDMQPLIRHRLGNFVLDPVWAKRTMDRFPEDNKKYIPIYYVPVHPKDIGKRDCLAWSALYGAKTAYWLGKKISKWVAPSKYYVSFPYGVYDIEVLRQYRKKISGNQNFILTYKERDIRKGEYLGFSFGVEDFTKFNKAIRSGTGIIKPGKFSDREKLPVEERWSARFFTLEKVFGFLDATDATIVELPWYYNIDSWENYCNFLSTDKRKLINRSELIFRRN